MFPKVLYPGLALTGIVTQSDRKKKLALVTVQLTQPRAGRPKKQNNRETLNLRRAGTVSGVLFSKALNVSKQSIDTHSRSLPASAEHGASSHFSPASLAAGCLPEVPHGGASTQSARQLAPDKLGKCFANTD